MGMYTELVCAFELKGDTPKQVLRTLCYMTGDENEEILDLYGIPTHPLFLDGNRWRFMLQCDSYYFDGETNSKLTTDLLIPEKPSYYLTVRCNLKNYNDEIEKFIDWLKPHIATDHEHQFIGYKRYETDNEPTLIYV
ncbi:hypothetical protein AB1L07_02480 [Niallia alba]|uniref:hypothetical protein n=1 Tax=Niallia alba TaxID=2729105 RepID=UPI0039A09AB7